MESGTSEQELVALGAISAQTRGIEPTGRVEEDTGSGYLMFSGISETD